MRRLRISILDIGRIALSLNLIILVLGLDLEGLGGADSVFYEPLRVFGWLAHWNINLFLVKTLTVGSLIFLILGKWVWFSSIVSLAGAGYLFGYSLNFGTFRYSTSIPVLSLIMFALCPISKKKEDNETDSAFRIKDHIFLMRLALVYPFFAAGVSKLVISGVGWMSKENITRILELNTFVFREGAPSYRYDLVSHILSSPFFLFVIGAWGLLFELITPLALFDNKAGRITAVLKFLFQVGILVIMGHNFLKYTWPLYIYFLPNVYLDFPRLNQQRFS